MTPDSNCVCPAAAVSESLPSPYLPVRQSQALPQLKFTQWALVEFSVSLSRTLYANISSFDLLITAGQGLWRLGGPGLGASDLRGSFPRIDQIFSTANLRLYFNFQGLGT